MESITEIFSNVGFMPHIHCYLDRPALVWTMVVTDSLIGIAYLGISLTLAALIRKIQIPFSFVVLCFGVFIAACGGTHFMEVYNLWVPNYWAAALVKGITAAASVGTGIYLYRLRLPLYAVAEAAKLSEKRRLELEVLTAHLERRIEERTQDLQRAIRSRDEFFAIAAHELRTPLTVVKLKGQLAVRAAGDAEDKRQKHLADMQENIDRLVRLVEEMLDISRFRDGRLAVHAEPENLSEIVGASVNQLRPALAKHGNAITAEIEPEIRLRLDRMRMDQVLANLLTNAAKYARGSAVMVKLRRQGNAALLSVRDEGPGIALENQARIFDRFERVDVRSHVGGLGVGLYLSRAIVEAHGGTISVRSEVGKGAEFLVCLPLLPEKIEGAVMLGDFNPPVGDAT